MNILFDNNVILDVYLQRQDFESDSIALLNFAEERAITGFLCATTVTTIYYIIARYRDRSLALISTKTLLKIFKVAPVNGATIERAVQSKFSDFEDAVLYESAKQVGVDAIVTRNTRNFKSASLPIYSPHELLNILNKSEDSLEDTS